jgi:hypothetical protein
MRAAVVTRFGGPEVFELTELPDPVPGPGQVAITAARSYRPEYLAGDPSAKSWEPSCPRKRVCRLRAGSTGETRFRI